MSMRKKSAILVGCAYYGTQYQRYGCENDVRIMEEVLIRLGFRQENIKKLIQTSTPYLPNQPLQPTMYYIQDELDRLKSGAGVGDVLFFYFSGLVMVNQSNIPSIYSCDGHLIPATRFRSEGNQLPGNTNFTIVLESSNSVGFINPVDTNSNRILLSACRANETAKRVVPDGDNANAYGMFTHAIKMALNDRPSTASSITNEGLLNEVKAPIERYNQHACLYSSDNNRSARFLGYLGTDNE